MKPFIIGVSGGSGSGKTTVLDSIISVLSTDEILVIKHDDYYKDQSHLTYEERLLTNYDHPNSLDNALLLKDLLKLLKGESVNMPIYDFVNHTRSATFRKVDSKKVIIIEGILTIENKELRKLMDLIVFVECDLDTMFIRRLKRDVAERGRSMDSVIDQYQKTVKPMFYKFVKPSKRFADVIIPNHIKYSNATDLIILKIKSILNK